MPVSAGYHDPDWYMVVQGVLTTDTYDFYPWAEQSVDFGFSKFGELIYWNDVDEVGVGLQYPGWDVVETWLQEEGSNHVDPFANEIVSQNLWLNGWFMEVRYTHRSHRDRRLLAMAMFADMTVDGNDWNNGWPMGVPFTVAGGGRKTTGYAESEPIQVLYDGPRRFIAQTTTHVYDWIDQPDLNPGEVDHPDETWPLVDVMLTFVFNKVKKQVIIYKDIKQVIEGKELDSPIDIQFSNREEWDMGSNPTYRSWAHFYHQNFTTCYGPEWHMTPGIMRENIWSTEVERKDWAGWQFAVRLPDPDGAGPYEPPVVTGSTRVYLVDEITGELIFLEKGVNKDWHFQDTGQPGPDPANSPELILHPRPEPNGPGLIETGDEVVIVYKLWKYYDGWGESMSDSLDPAGDMSDGVPHLYDLVQVISEDLNWVGWKAFWPVLSDYTPDGWSQWWNPLIWVGETDLDSELDVSPIPDIAFTIGEWDFQLGDPDFPRQFRGVEVVGVTDRHDGDDFHRNGTQILDRELLYQVEEIFNPWDLKKAVHKETKTWVEWTDDSSWTSNHRPFAYWSDEEWGLYNDAMGNKVFSERVYDLTNDVLLNRWEGDYALSVTPDGYGVITGLTSGIDYKIMYHTLPQTVGKWVVNSTYTYEGPMTTDIMVPALTLDEMSPISAPIQDNLGAWHGMNITFGPMYVNVTTLDANFTETFEWEADIEEYDFKVYKEDRDSMKPGIHKTVIEDPAYPDDIFPRHDIALVNSSISIDVDPFYYWISSSNDLDVSWPEVAETLHVKELIHTMYLMGTVSYNTSSGNSTVTLTVQVEVDYDEMLGGRWEHTVVGKDAASVDSAGAALITAAFKNKQREIGIAALDIQESEPANDIPWVMRKFGGMVDSTVEDYYHAPPEDMRVSLSDDWCHTWPVSGSNLISVGGPIANVLTYYVNDFTDAFWGHPAFTPGDSPWLGEVAAIACWNKNSYMNDEDTGYAVIGTYHDINGSTILTIWGLWGRDTYYASRFFHEELIQEFQRFPKCATSVILEIDYTDPKHPTFDIVEVVGTISEHSDWMEIWLARKWLADHEPDYLDTYPATGGPCDWEILKGGLHDP
jgi:hypothetical protein